MSRYLTYCAQQAVLPWTAYSLSAYVMALSISHHAYSYIASEASHVSLAATDRGLSPLASPLLDKCLRAARRTPGSHTVRKEPISLPLLTRLIDLALASGSASGLRDAAFLAVGWFGLLRGSELTALTWADVRFCPEGVMLHLATSKTDQTGRGAWILLGSLPAEHLRVCPVVRLRALLDTATPPGPLFAHSRTGQPLATDTLRSTLKSLLRRADTPHPSLFSLHSLRRGGATAAAQGGLPVRQIQEHGRWVSDTVRLYMYCSDTERWSATRSMLTPTQG